MQNERGLLHFLLGRTASRARADLDEEFRHLEASAKSMPPTVFLVSAAPSAARASSTKPATLSTFSLSTLLPSALQHFAYGVIKPYDW